MQPIRDHLFKAHTEGEAAVCYEISDQDAGSDPKYYGYLAYNGAWIIQEFNVAAGTFRYKSGTSLYAANWTGRAGLSYGYFNTI